MNDDDDLPMDRAGLLLLVATLLVSWIGALALYALISPYL